MCVGGGGGRKTTTTKEAEKEEVREQESIQRETTWDGKEIKSFLNVLKRPQSRKTNLHIM